MKCEFCNKKLSAKEIEFCEENMVLYICSKCIEEHTSVCEDCGALIIEGEGIYINDYEKYICESCYDNNYDICDHCGDAFNIDDLVSSNYHDVLICPTCFEEYYAVCENCNDVYHRDYIIYDEYSGCYFCDECYEEHPPLIKNYNYIPDEWKFYKKDDEKCPLYMGIELEIDNNKSDKYECNDLALELDEIIGHRVIFKQDGSLDCGFEIVSHPCSLKYHKKHIKWKEAFEHIKEYGFKSHDAGTCGLHITVSKPDEVQIAKLILFFEKFWDKILRISRRTKRQYNEWCSRYFSDGEVNIDKIENVLKSTNSKYKAINISKKDVIEFRIFRGTLNLKTFYASLEFIYNLMMYIQTLSIEELLNSTFNDFIEYSKKYGEVEYMIDYFKKLNLY